MITGKKGLETMMAKLDKLRELTICCVDELRDEAVTMAETTSFCLSEKDLNHRRTLTPFPPFHSSIFSSLPLAFPSFPSWESAGVCCIG